MTFIGIDVHRSSSTVKWFCPADGTSGSRRISTTSAAYEKLLSSLPRPWVVAFEATREAPALTKLLRRLDADELHLVHPRAMRALGELQKAKTDDKDAALILSLLQNELLPEAYLAPPDIEEQREVSRGYQSLRQMGTRLQNALRCLFNKAGLACEATKLLSRRGRQQVPELIATLAPFAAIMATMYWQQLLTIDEHCTALQQLMKAQVLAHPAGPGLLALDGLGVVTTFGLIAEIGQIGRFASPKRLHSYAGLVPKIKQSDSFYSTGHLSQDCNKPLRFFAVCGAQGASRCKAANRAKAAYERVKRQDPKRANIAKIAAGRKLLTDVYWVWQTAVA
jgi:transposase